MSTSDATCYRCGGPLPSPFRYCPMGERGGECEASPGDASFVEAAVARAREVAREIAPTDPAVPPARDGGPAMPADKRCESCGIPMGRHGYSCGEYIPRAGEAGPPVNHPDASPDAGQIAELKAEVDRLKRRCVAEKDSHDRDGRVLLQLKGDFLRAKTEAHKLRKALDALLELCVRPNEDEQGEWYYFTDLDVTVWDDEGETIERPTWKTQAEAFRAILAQIHCAELAEGIDEPS